MGGSWNSPAFQPCTLPCPPNPRPDSQHTYVRLESTACEQGRLEALLLGLDANLLMSLALGHCCLVWDLGSRNKTFAVPRALW